MKEEVLSKLIHNAEPISEELPRLSVIVKMPGAGCGCSHPRTSRLSSSEQRSLNWKLLLLLLVASCSLICILVISQQLIVRHWAEERSPVKLEIRIPEDGWMSSQGLHEKLLYPGQEVDKFMVEVVPLGEDMEEGQKDDNESHYHKYEEETDEIKYYSGLGVSNTNEVQLVEDGIYWSEAVEETISPGLSDDLVQDEILALRSRTVKSLDTPTWLKCGRDKNRFVTFSDGVHACARYREPDQQLVLGEVMSFYLARTLGLTNVPAVILSQVDPNHPMWRRVTEDVATSDWRVGSVVALIQWIPSLQRSHMPAILRQALKARTTIDTVTYDRRASRDVSRAASVAQARLRDLDITEAAEVAQWSDLVVFDYLTGNYDRVASMQDAAEREKRPEILSETVHNLVKSSDTGSLWMIDNESGMLDAYNLLYPEPEERDSRSRTEAVRFQRMHSDMLQTLCVFRRSTVNKVFSLYRQGDAVTLLEDLVTRNEPVFKEMIGFLHIQKKDRAWRKYFHQRVEEVWTWMKQCQESAQY